MSSSALTETQVSLGNIVANAYLRVERWLRSRYWKLQLLVVCVVVAFAMQVPRYNHYYRYAIQNNGERPVFTAFKKQVAAPFEPQAYTGGSHEEKISFRLTMPLIIRALHLPPAAFPLVQLFFGLLMQAALIRLIFDITDDRVSTAFLMVGVNCIYFGCAYLFDVFAWFDSLAYAALVLMLVVRQPAALAGLFLLGAFTDERTIVAVPIVVLWHVCRRHADILTRNWQGLIRALLSTPQAAGIAAGLALYGLLRFWLSYHFHLHSGSGDVGVPALVKNGLGGAMEAGFLSGLESFWALVVGAFAVLLVRRAQYLALALLLAMLPIFAGAFLVFDITRSMSYGAPVFILSLYLLRPYLTQAQLRHFACFIMLGAIFTPTVFIISNINMASSFVDYATSAVFKRL